MRKTGSGMSTQFRSSSPKARRHPQHISTLTWHYPQQAIRQAPLLDAQRSPSPALPPQPDEPYKAPTYQLQLLSSKKVLQVNPCMQEPKFRVILLRSAINPSLWPLGCTYAGSFLVRLHLASSTSQSVYWEKQGLCGGVGLGKMLTEEDTGHDLHSLFRN